MNRGLSDALMVSNRLLLVGLVLGARSARADCAGPPDFSPWCSTGATTAVAADVRRAFFADRAIQWQVTVASVSGAPLDGVVEAAVLVVNCVRGSRLLGPVKLGSAGNGTP